jgi:threonine dehydrogenase-like Zn-dependent dehydrogenase
MPIDKLIPNMQAVWLENGKITLRDDLPIPSLPAGEALVRVRLAGICSTDLELVRGYYPYTGILGHEFVGDVVQAPGRPELVGKRVVGEINAVCGACQMCRTQNPTHCERRTVLGIVARDGAFADYLTLPVENLHLVPERLTDEQAVFTEPLAAALEIQEQVRVSPGARVLLIGAGRLGQLIAQSLSLTGCALQVVARYQHQRDLLAGYPLQFVDEAVVPDNQIDLVVEATGSPAGFELAKRAVRPRGTVVLKSTYAGKLEVNFSEIVVDEITLVGSRCGPFPAALRLLEGGQVNPLPLISGRYPLSKGLQAFKQAREPGMVKILLEPEPDEG